MENVDAAHTADHRSTRDRIRDSAIECIAELGVRAMTARMVAAAAGVSPGLVIHHFGSMEGLRSACDEHVATTIRHLKREAVSLGLELDVLAALRDGENQPLAAYLVHVLADDSPIVAKLVDDLIADAEEYLQDGVGLELIRPTDDPHGRAVVMILWSLGGLVLHRHFQRLLGVDLIDPALGKSPAIAAYAQPAYEILGGGIFTEAFAARLREAFDQQDESKGHA